MFLTTGEVGLAAALLTAVAGFGGAWVQSRRDDKRWDRERAREQERWQREDRSRWDVEKLKAYTNPTTRIEELRIAIYDYRDSEDRPTRTRVISPAFHARTLARMLANEDTRKAIDAMWQAALVFSRDLQIQLDRKDFIAANSQLRAQAGIYERAVRLEMGIAEGATELDNDEKPREPGDESQP